MTHLGWTSHLTTTDERSVELVLFDLLSNRVAIYLRRPDPSIETGPDRACAAMGNTSQHPLAHGSHNSRCKWMDLFYVMEISIASRKKRTQKWYCRPISESVLSVVVCTEIHEIFILRSAPAAEVLENRLFTAKLTHFTNLKTLNFTFIYISAVQ